MDIGCLACKQIKNDRIFVAVFQMEVILSSGCRAERNWENLSSTGTGSSKDAQKVLLNKHFNIRAI
jgi:hypothetical protein